MSHRRETAFGQHCTCSLLHWEQELFPWELFHASLYAGRYLQWVSYATLPFSFLPTREWEASALRLLSTAGQGFYHFCQGREVTKHGWLKVFGTGDCPVSHRNRGTLKRIPCDSSQLESQGIDLGWRSQTSQVFSITPQKKINFW